MKNNIKTTGIIVSLVMLLSKVFGMLRDIIIASMYGTATVEAISFSTASRIPLLFFDIAAQIQLLRLYLMQSAEVFLQLR